jgi:hypothetical protein
MRAVEQNRAPDRSQVAWSCALDDKPALWNHFLVWIATLTDCAGVAPETIVVHHVTELRPDIRKVAARLGLRTQLIPRFDPRSPHANKIAQCFSDFGGAGRVVLTDVDLAFLARPPVERIGVPLAGKPVDLPNPPIEVLSDLFRQARVPVPNDRLAASYLDSSGALKEFHTFPANYNGGLYVVDCAVLADFGSRWAHWARWLLDAPIPARYAVFVDQVAFCVAANELGLDAMSLDSTWNLPSHVPTPSGDAPPFVVHHHGRLDEALRLLPLRPPRHAGSIAAANAVVSAFLDRHDIAPATLVP